MDLSVWRKLKAVGDIVDDGSHMIRPIVSWPELALGGHMQGGWSSMTEVQPYPIAHCIVGFAMILVVVAFVDSMGLLQAAMGIG